MNEYITRLIDITVALERQQCAHHYLALMRDAVEQARTKEREKCAGDYLEDCANAVEAAKQECETCAAKRKRLMEAGFLKSPLRGEDHVD